MRASEIQQALADQLKRPCCTRQDLSWLLPRASSRVETPAEAEPPPLRQLEDSAALHSALSQQLRKRTSQVRETTMVTSAGSDGPNARPSTSAPAAARERRYAGLIENQIELVPVRW